MRRLSWKWVGVGSLLIFGMYQGWSYLLAIPLGGRLIGALGIPWGVLVFTAAMGLLSYFLGGVVVGRLSPGITIREPAIASVFAILADLGVTIGTRAAFPSLLGLVVALMLGLGLGYLGGKLGELWQERSRPKPRQITPAEAPPPA